MTDFRAMVGVLILLCGSVLIWQTVILQQINSKTPIQGVEQIHDQEIL